MKEIKRVSQFTASILTLFFLLLGNSCNEPAYVQPQRQFGGTMTAQVNGTAVSLSQISITVGQGGFALETKVLHLASIFTLQTNEYKALELVFPLTETPVT